jgi:hypothetical protein
MLFFLESNAFKLSKKACWILWTYSYDAVYTSSSMSSTPCLLVNRLVYFIICFILSSSLLCFCLIHEIEDEKNVLCRCQSNFMSNNRSWKRNKQECCIELEHEQSRYLFQVFSVNHSIVCVCVWSIRCENIDWTRCVIDNLLYLRELIHHASWQLRTIQIVELSFWFVHQWHRIDDPRN